MAYSWSLLVASEEKIHGEKLDDETKKKHEDWGWGGGGV